jgi:cell division protease FtsH
MAGLEKKNRHLNEKEKNIVAYHESGHAIVGAAVENSDPVHKVSIVSRGMGALGYTLQVPLEDRYLMTRNEIRDKICMMLGGRAAEAIIFEDISTGASDDLKRITNMARNMVIQYGMSEAVGNVNYGDDDDDYGGLGLSQREYSEETAEEIDREVHQIIEQLYDRTLEILRENIDTLHDMADFLKENEVLEGDDLDSFLEKVRPDNGEDDESDSEPTVTGT